MTEERTVSKEVTTDPMEDLDKGYNNNPVFKTLQKPENWEPEATIPPFS